MPWSCRAQGGHDSEGAKTSHVRVKGKKGKGKVVSHHKSLKACKSAVRAAERGYHGDSIERDIEVIAGMLTDNPDIINEGTAIKITKEMIEMAKSIRDKAYVVLKRANSTKDYEKYYGYVEKLGVYHIDNHYGDDNDTYDSEIAIKVFINFRIEREGTVRAQAHRAKTSKDYASIVIFPTYSDKWISPNLYKMILHEIIHIIDPKMDKPGTFEHYHEYLTSPIEMDANISVIAHEIIDNMKRRELSRQKIIKILQMAEFNRFKLYTSKDHITAMQKIFSDAKWKRKFLNTLYYYLSNI